MGSVGHFWFGRVPLPPGLCHRSDGQPPIWGHADGGPVRSLCGTDSAMRPFGHRDLLGPCAGLTLLCVLLATVGGFSDFFSVFVSPEIRCYARIFPFIGFFSIVAAATLLPPLDRRLTPVLRIAVLTAITVLAGFDQAAPSRAHNHTEAVYQRDDDFVRLIETVLPSNSAVFQLPYTDFPNEIPLGKAFVNDSLRPYLHSWKYRWSWPAVIDRKSTRLNSSH